MKKQKVIIAMALLGLVPAACHKNQPIAEKEKPVVSVETKLRAACGFAVQIPSDAEGYAAFYNLHKLWLDIKQSKTLADISANPLFKQLSNDPSVANAKAMASGNPEVAKWRAVLSEALGSEAFIEFAPGSAEKWKALMQLSDEMRMANFEDGFEAGLHGKNTNPKQNPALLMLPYVGKVGIPPILLGFKLSTQKAALVASLEQGEKMLPPGIELTSVNVGNTPFKLISVTAGKVMPPAQQEELKSWVASNTTDPKQAEEIYQGMLARHMEVAYGFMGDYFIVTIGEDHAHLKFASSFGESLLSRPEVAVVADYSDKPLFSFSWSDAKFLSACQRRLNFGPYYDRFKGKIAQSVSPADLQKLQDDVKRLDTEADAAFVQDFTPMVGLSYRDHGLRGEMFGGMKVAPATAGVKFSSVPNDSTFLWIDSASNPIATTALRTWFEDICTTSYDTFQRIGLASIGDKDRAQFAFVQEQAVPRIVEFYKITRDQFAKSLGSENAFAMDLNGAVPEFPLIPPAFHDQGRMPRFAYLSDVQDRALLAQSWSGYLKLARDVAQLAPPTPMLAGGIPDPGTETVDGVTLSFYRPPMQTGDLLPNVATTDKTFVVSTSRAYSLELSKAAMKSAALAKPLLVDFRMNFKPAFDFVENWIGIAAQYPALFFQTNPAAGQQFATSKTDISALFHSLRAFEGVDMRVYQENGLRRVSSAIRWNERPAAVPVAAIKN